MNGRNWLPMWFFIRFVKWRQSLSSLEKLSFFNPKILLLSSTPIRRFPPEVFRNAVIVFSTLCSIFLSD